MKIEEISINNDGNVIKSITSTSLEDLAILKHMIKSEEYKIEEININFEESIKDKIKEKNSAQAPILNRIEQFKKSYDEMFREICDNAKFEEDRFLKDAKN